MMLHPNNYINKKNNQPITNNDDWWWSNNDDITQTRKVSVRDDRTAECSNCDPLDDVALDLFPSIESNVTLQATNQPHPALDTPLFYRMLKMFPALLEKVKVLYENRWWMSYPLQHRVPFSHTLLKMGLTATWGELLLCLPYVVIVITGILWTMLWPSVAATGKVARLALIASILLANRNSIITFLIGMPVDRTLFYHKFAGFLAGVTGVLHTIAFFVDPNFRSAHDNDLLGGALTGQINTSGTAMLLVIVCITATSVKRVRRYCFELFYALHLVFIIALVVGAFFHSGKLVPMITLSTWGVDMFIRKVLMTMLWNPKQATLKILSNTVIEVCLPKTPGFAYNPGQYVFLSVPAISFFEWHPFSISTSPDQLVVKLYIRKVGDWTSELYDLAKTEKQVNVFVEGPYGNLSVDLMGDRKYKRVLLISGGIGITPMQSICSHLLHEWSTKKRELHQLKFIWVERDPVLIQRPEFITSKNCNGQEKYNSNNNNMTFSSMITPGYIAEKLLTIVPLTETSDTELDEQYDEAKLFTDSDSDDMVVKDQENPPIMQIEKGTPSKDFAMKPNYVGKEKVLDMQVYLTGKVDNNNTIDDAVIPYARLGRPDIKKIFVEMKESAITTGDKKVAVCVSAPKPLMKLVHKACILYSDESVRFDFHSESVG